MGMGKNVNGNRLSILLYADDAVVMSECGNELQAMLNVVNVYSRELSILHSMDVMVWSKRDMVLLERMNEDRWMRRIHM